MIDGNVVFSEERNEQRESEKGIFLSYAGVDRDIAAHMVQGLRAVGCKIWWDRDGVGWGENWINRLQETISSCSAYLILIGTTGVRRWVKAELYIATRRHFEEDLPIFPILLHGVAPESLPPFLSVFQAQRLPEDLEELDFAELAGQLRQSDIDASPPSQHGVCPFPGLEAFDENDAPFFFGRQIEALDALRRLGQQPYGPYRRWLQVEGPSGVGKSSLVRAGLVPAIKRGWLEGDGRKGGTWRVAPPMRPGADPIENLADILSKSLGSEIRPLALTDLDRQLRDERKALRHLLRQCLAEADRFVLVIDQLEEVFTLAAKAEDREQFDALVAQALDDIDGPLHLISTIRSDFMLRFTELPRLAALLNQSAGRYFLRPMDEAGLHDVVRTPAQLAGLHWSEPSLPRQIVEEALAEPGALPLVGNLLRLLWDERDDNVLSARVYHELGGLGGALATRADMLLSSLGEDGTQRARRLFLELVEPGHGSHDTRRTITREQALKAAGDGQEAEAVLDALSGLRTATTPRAAKAMPRLVLVSSSSDIPEGRDADARVDLAHEALLRADRRGRPYWRTLRDWVAEYRRQLEDRRLLEILAEKWQAGGRRGHELARGRQLREFRRAGAAVSDLAIDYLRTSRRRIWLRAAAGAMTIVLVTGIAYGSWWAAEHGVTPRDGMTVLALRVGLIDPAPEMVTLEGGTFLMGSTEEERNWAIEQGAELEWVDEETPRHKVTVPAFAIGKYEVTFDEWQLCVVDGGCTAVSDENWGRGRRPVINISWHDAKAYVHWLSRTTGESYRLPSEAEWEYAARAGTDSFFWWGDEPPSDHANFGDKVDKKTTEVGAYRANPWGLYDMNGNVWEWVEDCWHFDYIGAPDDGTAWARPDCGAERVLRGGSWYDVPRDLRSANRFWMYTVRRESHIGFRVAKTLR